MTPKPVAARVAALRQRRAALGLTRLEAYVHPDDHAKVKALVSKLARARSAKASMAREAELASKQYQYDSTDELEWQALARFAALAAAAERDRMIADGWRQCAKGQRTTQFCGMAEQAYLNQWARNRLSRHGIPMPDEDEEDGNPSFG